LTEGADASLQAASFLSAGVRKMNDVVASPFNNICQKEIFQFSAGPEQ
jgi:hypothetical protein